MKIPLEHLRQKKSYLFVEYVVLILLAVSLVTNSLPTNNEDTHYPVVVTPKGSIQGIRQTVLGHQVDAFLGIPYAQPPVGELRFRKPNGIIGWTGIIRATKKPLPCFEYRYDFTSVPWLSPDRETEDCLYLNVWTPVQRHNGTLKTVLVWIYGGGFIHGSSDVEYYDGQILAAFNDVVVVTFNYRVGIFGFLRTTETNPSGNIGLYDQVLALKWVRETIQYFGGDLNNIVLFGESAGAISVGLHLISPLSKHLFNRAIMQSESGTFSLFLTPRDDRQAKLNKIVSLVGCLQNDTTLETHPDEILRCLRTVRAEVLNKAQKNVLDDQSTFTIIPNIGDEFLPENPFHVFQKGEIINKDVLIGSNRDEGTFFLHFHAPKTFPNDQPKNVSLETVKKLMSGYFSFMSPARIKAVIDVLLEGKNVTGFDNIRRVAAENLGDSFITCPTVYFAKKYSSVGNRVFYYMFDHRPSRSSFHEWFGVTHFEEVQFVFGQPLKHPQRYTDEEIELSKKMMEAWTTFAKFGTPSLPKSEGIEWPPFTINHPAYARFQTKTVSVETNPYNGRCDVWEVLYDSVQ